MELELRIRGPEEVTLYFQRTSDEEIRQMLPRTVTTLEQALDNYRTSLLPGASSFGRTIYCDGAYIGDVWCYAMERGGAPEAMLGFCIFEKGLWGRGIATRAVSEFLKEVNQKFSLIRFGAFCYAHNIGSRRVLEKNGFSLVETFSEDGADSCYLEVNFTVEEG